MNNVEHTNGMTEDEMLAHINTTLENLGSTMRWKKVSKPIPGCESLYGKKILLVDDVFEVIENLVADLVFTTGGNASFLHYKDEILDQVVERILAHDPEVILMDYTLSDSLKGDSVVRAVRERKPDIICIGFSSEKDTADKFAKVGAGFAEKEAWDGDASLQRVVEAVKKSVSDTMNTTS